MDRFVFLMALVSVIASTWPACEPGSDARGSDSDTDTDSDGDGDGDGDTDDDTCDPGEIWCLGTWIAECNEGGDGWDQLEDCTDQGLVCAAGECVDTTVECATAINEKSYIGCEYWGVTLANGVDATAFYYAIAVANRGGDPAAVHITDAASISHDYTVPANDMIVISDLPWKAEIKAPGTFLAGDGATRKVSNAAYRVTSDRPVTVYQFSALEYESSGIFSYTNDASLLLPAHVYRDEYVVMSRPNLKISEMGTDPGLLAIVGPAGGPTTVEISVSAYTRASDAYSNESFPAHSPGDTFQVTLQPHEVFQLLTQSEAGCTGGTNCEGYTCCNTPSTYDLSGSVITVIDGPAPAVFGGTECSFVPFDRWACDHLEEQMFPLETWGTHYLCGANPTQAAGEPTVWRVMSGSDGNSIAFNPSSVHGAVTLGKGEFIEFETQADFEVTGEGRVSVAQFTVGQNYTSPAPLNGDPAMALAVPVEQYRKDYTFFAPLTYVYNYLTVVHKPDAYPTLDGSELTGGYTQDINGEYVKTNVEITGGIHNIESTEPFAINVYGVGAYTSYMYPGGLDLGKVDIIVE